MKATCIMCPMGCELNIKRENNEIIVSGHTCQRGVLYGKKEFTSPERIVTSLVFTLDGQVVPCKTKNLIKKADIPIVLEALKGVRVKTPVHIGDILLKDICGSDVIATREVLDYKEAEGK